MKASVWTAIALALVLTTATASAAIIPTATIAAKADGANFDYTIELTNSGASTDVIGTFWYAWVPGEDFLPTAPIAGTIRSPSGWDVAVTHFPDIPTNGFALQWVASSTAAALAPGDSLTFGFSSADTPAQVFGISPFYPGTPVGTSFVYHAGPFSDPGVEFQVTAVPEPSSLALALGGLGALGLAVARRRRRARSRAAQAGRATP